MFYTNDTIQNWPTVTVFICMISKRKDLCYLVYQNRIVSVLEKQRVKTFPHTTHLQKTSFKSSRQKILKEYTNEGIVTKKNVENVVAKGKIAYIEQFLLLSGCFQKLSATDVSKWERVKTCLFLLQRYENRLIYQHLLNILHFLY